MGCRTGVILAEEENGVSTSVNDALLFTTMCIIGNPVDVHVKDGSIYSGTLYTANVDNAYAVVLKKAKRIKKGNRETNVADGKLIDTLVIVSEDLVQVVAKELLLPAEGICGKVGADHIGAGAGIDHQNERDEILRNTTNHRDPESEKKDTLSSRLPNDSLKDISGDVANQESDGTNLVKKGDSKSVSSSGRQGGREKSEVEPGDFQAEPAELAARTTEELGGPRSSSNASQNDSNAVVKMIAGTNKIETPIQRTAVAKHDDPLVRHTLEESQESLALSSGVSVDATSDVRAGSDFSRNVSPAPMKVVVSEKGNRGLVTKESKLNPRAKLFSPSPAQHRSATPPTVPSSQSMNHISEPSPPVAIAATEPEVDISSYAYRSSVPAKFAPHNNLFFGNGRGDMPYAQHFVGHTGSRTPPIRYAGQYSHLQAGPPYVHPNSQTVMAGRMGPLIYVQPVSNDVTQGAVGFSQLASRPLIAPPQVNIPKHQGTATMQALQLYVTPPFIANGQQTFAMPTYIPISPPIFPVVGSIPVPGSDGSFSTKFA